MAMAKDKARIKKYGGGVLQVYQVDEDGADNVSGSWLNLGYVEKTTISDVTDTEDIQDETGNTVTSDEANRVVKVNVTLMQSDKALLDFLKETCRGNYYLVYWYGGINDGNYQDYLFGICKIKPGIELESGVKRPPVEITVLENTSALTYDGYGTASPSNIVLPSGSHVAAESQATISANEYYSITETAV